MAVTFVHSGSCHTPAFIPAIPASDSHHTIKVHFSGCTIYKVIATIFHFVLHMTWLLHVQEASDYSHLNSTQAVLPNPPARIGRPVLSVLIQHGGKGGRKEAG